MTTAIIPNDSRAVLVDSSGWLEYLTSDEKASIFAPYLESKRRVLIPTIIIFEVRKILLLRRSRPIADEFVGEALSREVVDLDGELALAAVELSIRHQLPMADAIIYATAQARQAELVTSDSHFAGLPGVTVL
jgi:predicted nucleic acid-binding protein